MSKTRRAPARLADEIIKDPSEAGPGSYVKVEGGYRRVGETTALRDVAEGRAPKRAAEAAEPLPTETQNPTPTED